MFLFILVTCRSHFGLYHSQFLVNWFYFQLLQNFFNHFVVTKGCTLLFWKISYRLISIVYYPLFPRVQISLPYKIMRTASVMYTVVVAHFWTEAGSKLLFRIHSIWANFATFCRIRKIRIEAETNNIRFNWHSDCRPEITVKLWKVLFHANRMHLLVF